MPYLIILAVLLAAPMALAQDGHPLAQQPGGRAHPLAAPGEAEKQQCVEYITCESLASSPRSFSNGELWRTEVDCSTCGGQVYRGRLEVLMDAYLIQQFEHDKGVTRFLMRRKPY
jgi:hypothetical protein